MNKKKAKIKNMIGTGTPLDPKKSLVLNEQQYEDLMFPFASRDEELPEVQGVPWNPEISELDAARVVNAWLPEARRFIEKK